MRALHKRAYFISDIGSQQHGHAAEDFRRQPDGVLGGTADAPLVVQLGNPGNTGLSGQPVTWTVISGQASLAAGTTQTDSNGFAQVAFTFGNSAGAVTIQASSIAGKVDFNATAYSATVAVASGDNQTGAIGGTLAPFVVQVTSSQATAKGIAQVPVQWKITSGGGTLPMIHNLDGRQWAGNQHADAR